jgi:hypothetical protein
MSMKQFCLVWLVLLMACERPLPTFDGADMLKWKNDKMGCQGERKGMRAALERQKAKLQGLSESQIIKLLGRPDQNELYKRNQKFYYYWITGSECSTDTAKVKLGIRFTAMSIAKEISFD